MCGRNFSLGIASVALILAHQASLAHAQTIQGIVVNSKGQPVSGVTVELHPTGNKDTSVKVQTSSTGAYTIQNAKFTAAYDIVYSHSKMDSTIVSRLVENKEQEINKVMHFKGQPRSAQALLDALHSAERIFLLSISTDDSKRRSELAKLIDKDDLKELFGKDTLLEGEEKDEVKRFVEFRRKELSMILLRRPAKD